MVRPLLLLPVLLLSSLPAICAHSIEALSAPHKECTHEAVCSYFIEVCVCVCVPLLALLLLLRRRRRHSGGALRGRRPRLSFSALYAYNFGE